MSTGKQLLIVSVYLILTRAVVGWGVKIKAVKRRSTADASPILSQPFQQ
jgi:hypothetical protein